MRARMFESGLRYVCVVGLSFAASGMAAKSLSRLVLKSMSAQSDVPERPLSRVEIHLRAQTVALVSPVLQSETVDASAVTPDQMLPVSALVAGLERAETAAAPEPADTERPVTKLPDIAPLSNISPVSVAREPSVSAACQRPKCPAAGHRAPLRLAAKAHPKGKQFATAERASSSNAKTSKKIVAQDKQKTVLRSTEAAQVSKPDRKQRLANAETPEILMRRGFLGRNS